MTFGTPQMLLLFLLVPFFLLLHYRSFSDMSVFQRRLSLSLRLLLISAIIFALADAKLIKRSDKLAVYFLWDGSRSMGEESKHKILDFIHQSIKHANKYKDKAGVIAFGRDALIEKSLGSDLNALVNIQSDVKPDFTNIARAIELAIADIPTDHQARIIILSDGNENLGDAIASARHAVSRGVEICAVPFGEPAEGEVAVGKIILPRHVETNEMFDVRTVIQSETESKAIVEVFENEKLIGAQKVHLKPGKNVFAFPRQLSSSGFYSYRIQVTADRDIESANNAATDFVIVEGAPRVCYVSGDRNEKPYLVNTLRNQAVQADFYDLSGLPTSLLDMLPYDVFFFSDVGAELLMPETMKAYQAYVRDLGGGFGMFGGRNSFGPGGYYQTPIEELLPVTMDFSRNEYLPPVGLILVIDKSGSMGEIERGGVQKIDIAKTACAKVVDLLEATDKIGIIGFDSLGTWVVEFQNVTDINGIKRKIGTMRAGGGTNLYPPMVEAFNTLKNSDVKIKHMIVLSDGITEPGAFQDLVQKMNESKITLSTIAIGSDSNLPLMEKMAKDGGGSYYFCTDITAVPQIFTKETFHAANRAIVEAPFTPVENQLSPITEDIDWSNSPPLLGYVATTIKPRATEALVTHRADPLLSHWQYGLGRSMAFTSDAKAHWGVNWLKWPGYSQIWTKAVRWLVGGSTQSNLNPNIYIQAGKAHISVDAIDPKGEMLTDASIKTKVVFPDMSSSELNLFQVAPGRYETSIETSQIGTYLVHIFQENSDGNTIDQVTSGFSVSYPPEYEKIQPNVFLLSKLCNMTNGKLNISPEDVFSHNRNPSTNYFDLWYILLIVAVCIFPFDVAARRLAVTGETAILFRQRLVQILRSAFSRKIDAKDASYIEQLKKIKKRYKITTDLDVSTFEPSIPSKAESKISQTTRKTDREPSGDTPQSVISSQENIEQQSSFDRLKKAKERALKDKKHNR